MFKIANVIQNEIYICISDDFLTQRKEFFFFFYLQ